MKYFIIAGEKSGDLHAGNLACELNRQDTSAKIKGWGGSEMKTAGVEILQNCEDLAFMGLDFIFHLNRVLRLFSNCKQQIKTFSPDVLVLVDYSGFNLRIAKWAKKRGMKVSYYIAPKTWAWNSFRNRKIKKYVDELLLILPFEKNYFDQFQIRNTYVGNPLVERIDALEKKGGLAEMIPSGTESIIALLPGSRRMEIKRASLKLKKTAKHFKNSLFVVAGISEIDKNLYHCFESIPNCHVVYDKTYQLLEIADVAIVTSGTATLETALFDVPQIVVYRTSELTYQIARKLVSVKHISLVNLILDSEAIPELIQNNFNSANLKKHLKELLFNTKSRQLQLDNYRKLKEIVGNERASEKAAECIINLVNKP